MSITPRAFSTLAALAIFVATAHGAPPEAGPSPASDEQVLQVQLYHPQRLWSWLVFQITPGE